MSKITGAQAVVKIFEQQEVKKVFCVPGESYLGVLDALHEHPEIQLITNRHEGGASFMAEAYAKASGRVGVCAATRGPGAANLSIGIHTAYQDSTPLVAIIGQVERPYKDRDAFQEVDLKENFRHLCKWTVEIQDAHRIPELMHRAFYVAQSGRPGPVVVSLPHDMLEDTIETEELTFGRYWPAAVRSVDERVEKALEEIHRADRPVVIAGGGVIRSNSTDQLIRIAQSLQLPVVTAFRRFDAFPNDHPCYAGWLGFGADLALLDYIASSDLVIALGTRFSQVTTQDYSLLKPGTRLIHVDSSPEVLGKVYTPTLPIVSDVKIFLTELSGKLTPLKDQERDSLIKSLHESYLDFSTPQADYSAHSVDMDGLIYDLRTNLPENTIITSDAGNFFGWISRYYRFNQPLTYIGPTSGAMGYGLPAAIGAKLANPERTVISFSGDGGFMMTMQELATAVHYNVPVVAIVINNNLFGTIRAHQEKQFPNRVVGTELTNPNFAEMAKLFGGYGERVQRNSDFIPALTRALQSESVAVIEVMTNPKILSVSQDKRAVFV